MLRLVQKLDIGRIDRAVYNPPDRTKKRFLKQLTKSIKIYGVLNPILVVKNGGSRFTVADGHRRLAVAENLGLRTIPAYVREESSEDIYRESTSRNKSGKDTMSVYLVNPNAVHEGNRKAIEGFRKFYGDEEFYKLAAKGFTIATFRRVRRVDTYLGTELVNTYARKQVDNVVKIAHWMVDQRQARIVLVAIKMGYPAGKIWTAIKKDRNLYADITDMMEKADN